jgi:hypothetical protein
VLVWDGVQERNIWQRIAQIEARGGRLMLRVEGTPFFFDEALVISYECCASAEASPEVASVDGAARDVYDYLIKHPGDTFGVFVHGDSMTTDNGVSVESGDLLIVDRALAPKAGDIVIEDHADGMAVTAYRSRLRLATVEDEQPVNVSGVVTFMIRAVGEEML